VFGKKKKKKKKHLGTGGNNLGKETRPFSMSAMSRKDPHDHNM